MRQLIYIPVIHTQVDMGSMAEALKEAYEARYGAEGWASHLKTIDQMWEGIARKIEELTLDFHRTKLYQDGLPVCGKEREIVTEVAGRGSRNYHALLDLMQKGCELVGTESAQLLVKEYQHLKSLVSTNNSLNIFLFRRLKSFFVAHQLLAARDRFIAGRIDETLQEGENGLLFIGIKHRVDRYLPKGISVKYLFHRLPFQYAKRFSL